MSKYIPIYKYNAASGEFEAGFRSISEAAYSVGCDESTIRKTMGRHSVIKGSYWSTIKADNFSSVLEILGQKEFFKEKQLESDQKRVYNNILRKEVKLENAVEVLHKEIGKSFNEVNWNYAVPNYVNSKDKKDSCLIVQLSDLHLDELVDHSTYKYNIKIASARLKAYRDYIEKYCNAFSPSRIILAMTGDMISSDKRLDNILAKATNRAKASVIATKLLAQFMIDISHFAPVKVISVVGNESRMAHEMGFNDVTITDNYDYLIHNQLAMLLSGKNNGIEFLNDGSDVEAVVSINGYNFLLFHGFSVKGKDSQAGMQSIIGKFGARGIPIHYALFGHVHFANITDLYARSSSLIGANAYSDRALNFVSVASQNLHLVDDSIHSIRVNLENYDLNNAYEIEELDEMYVTETADKAFYTNKKQYFVIPIE